LSRRVWEVPHRPTGWKQKEEVMDRQDVPRIREQAGLVAGALGIILIYFGVFATLMYPVLHAVGLVA
jgi:hypothetical protein